MQEVGSRRRQLYPVQLQLAGQLAPVVRHLWVQARQPQLLHHPPRLRLLSTALNKGLGFSNPISKPYTIPTTAAAAASPAAPPPRAAKRLMLARDKGFREQGELNEEAELEYIRCVGGTAHTRITARLASK